jgi:predicted permease
MKSAELGFKKRNVGLMVLFTVLTLGIYIGYWFLKERHTLESNDYKRIIPMNLWVAATIFLSISFFYHFIGAAFFTPYGKALFNSIDIIFTFYYLGLLYYSVFRIRDSIEDLYNEEIFKPWLLVLFNVWYLQFKINRLNEEPEMFQEAKVPVTD